MTTYNWNEIRDELTTAYGAGPGAKLEEDLIRHFRTNPARFVSEGRDVVRAVQRGTVSSGWGSLRWRLDQGEAKQEITAEDTTVKERAAKRAHQWMHAAGLHFDRAGELNDELFGHLGTLRHWRDDNALTQSMNDLWREVRPIGEQIDEEAIERAERHKQAHPQGEAPEGRPELIASPQWGPPTIDPDDDLPF